MKNFSLPEPIPSELNQNQFQFEVLHPGHLELDYHAVMSSKDFLRRWSNSEWPANNFTLEDNLFDLEWHFEEFKENTAFTYTILNHDRTLCLGCIYIRRVTSIQSLAPEEKAKLEPFHFFISYWVITDFRNTQLENEIFIAIHDWLLTTWQFQSVLFVSNSQIPEQNEIYRHNQMELFLDLQDKNRHQQFWIPIKG